MMMTGSIKILMLLMILLFLMMIFKCYMPNERILSNVDLHYCKWKLLIIRENIYEDFLRKGKTQARNYFVPGQLACSYN